MDAGFRTPLLDCFRRGDIARDIRLLAARGGLAPRAHEQLGLLILLLADPDPEIRAAADGTLNAIPREPLAAFLGRSDVAPEIRTFFADRGIEPVGAAPDADLPLVDMSSDTVAAQAGPEADPDAEAGAAVNRIAGMGVAERLSLAMKGTREERAILIRDPNRIVSTAVLSSPKIAETEVESFARMANVSEDVLRIIANTRAWMKHYAIAAALVRNPKTPVALSMNLLARLGDKDLRTLSTDRNIPDVLRLTARKKLLSS